MSLHAERSGSAVHELSTLMRSGTLSGLNEAQLLRRFTDHRDEAAFRAIVERHGPAVLGICRRTLNDLHSADDAFQATFLVLAQRARHIGQPDRLGGWLIGVARRVSRKARNIAVRRAEQETEYAAQAPMETQRPRDDGFELAAIVAEELAKLPDTQRQAVELCCFQGLSTDEAAERLGWPRGTVGTRVSRGRQQLRERLERRGVALSAALAALKPSLPKALMHTTARAAVSVQPSALGLSPAADELAKATLRSLTMTKLTLFATAVALAVGGAGVAAYQALAPRAVEANAPPNEARGFAAVDDQDLIQGSWVVTECTINGSPEEHEAIAVIGTEFIFKGRAFESQIPIGDGDNLTFQLRGSGDHKFLTIERPNTVRVLSAAYDLNAERLRLTTGGGGEPGIMVMVLVPKAKAPKLTPEQEARRKDILSSARTSAARAISVNNLKLIGLAMHNLNDSTGTGFPAAAICDNNGNPLLSWRVAILPYIEQEALYREFHLNESWDSPHNKSLIARMPRIFAPVGKVQDKADPGTTYYKALVGHGGILDINEPRPISQITDGTSNTILAVEANDPVVWTKPEDITPGDAPSVPELGALFDEGFNALYADGSVRFLKRDIKPEILRALITFNGGEVIRADSY